MALAMLSGYDCARFVQQVPWPSVPMSNMCSRTSSSVAAGAGSRGMPQHRLLPPPHTSNITA